MRIEWKMILLVVGVVVVGAGAAATLASAHPATLSTTSKLPAVVDVPAVISLTGAAGLPGGQVADGMKFAAAEINRTKFLGATKLNIQFNDDQSDSSRVVRLVSDVVNSKAPALLGPVASASALAVAPVAQKAGLPYIASQSQTTGLIPLLGAGSYVFRLTVPEFTYQHVTVAYLVRRKVKSSALLYIQEGAANTEWAQKIMPPILNKAGIAVSDTIGFPGAQTDFSALATRLVQSNPDAIGIATFGTQNSTVVSQLRQQGYKGIIYADLGFGGNTLAGAGSIANGSVWTTDFAPFMTAPSSVAFIKAWRKATKADPSNFNAEGYDAAWFVARALQRAQSVDRKKVRAAMEAVTKVGMPAAVGNLKFQGHDATASGILVQWNNGEVVPVR